MKQLTKQEILDLKPGAVIKIVDIQDTYEKEHPHGTVIEVYKTPSGRDQIKYKTHGKLNTPKQTGICNVTVGNNVSKEGNFKCSVSDSGYTSYFERKIFVIE